MRATPLLMILISLMLIGCQTSKEEIFPLQSGETMLDTWKISAGSSNELMDARSLLRRPLQPFVDIQTAYSRNSVNEIESQFRRLPNPDLVMYVFPHLAGTDPVPVPGYTTIFPLHTKVEYALPGERVEAY